MLPDRVSNPGPLTYESGALPIALRGPAVEAHVKLLISHSKFSGPRKFPLRYHPAGIWCQNDVVLTSMRRDDVASTLFRRHFHTKCQLGSI